MGISFLGVKSPTHPLIPPSPLILTSFQRNIQVITRSYHGILYPIVSMYGIFSYTYHKNQPNVGKYTIHGSYGYPFDHLLPSHVASPPLTPFFFVGAETSRGKSMRSLIGTHRVSGGRLYPKMDPIQSCPSLRKGPKRRSCGSSGAECFF